MPRRRNTCACAAPGCGEPIPAPRVMCKRHWAMLPDSLRAAIANSIRSGRRADLTANLVAAEMLIEARDEAAAA